MMLKPIPQLAAWEAHMTDCAKIIAAQPGSVDHSACTRPGCKVLNESLAWYYDGNRVFRQIARYTKDRAWLEAAKKCRLYYRSYLSCPTVGHYVDGWRNFTKGFFLNATEDNDATAKQDVLLIARRGKFSQPQHRADIAGWLTTPSFVDAGREIAYAISAWSASKALGDQEFARRDPYLDIAYFQLDTWRAYLQGYPASKYPGEPGAKFQPFMFALTAEALIEVYQRPDTSQADKEKIRTKLEAVARLTYDKLYSTPNHAFIANTGNPTTYWPAINLLIVPVYGWLWHETGAPYFLEAGDRIFADGVVYGWPEVWGGKQFSQNYRWSFDYVAWRQQAPK
ncbi:hypothetical protein [Armatimonas sp.]|uniref:hypothetical protein n=1 Tax=Armatimonas sp. TaxID=1872638 RepID=UPI0037509709